ncbi:MAG TPA: hypothetical protein VLA82_04950 [Actinomycetota bacterium]|nr:hypothetical protein [Actinomycetota bacterium]
MHQTHRPGTDSACRECRDLAYEPGWYAALAVFASDEPVRHEPVPAS